MFRNLIAASVFAASVPSAVDAQQVIAQYAAWLGPHDLVNSRSEPLTSFGTVLAQDRANFHRFGIRDEWDGTDPVFHDRAMRARLPALYEAGQPVAGYILDDVMSGRGHYVLVTVFGVNGTITHINVHEGAG